MSQLRFVYSSDLNIYVQLKISSLEGNLTKYFFKQKFNDKVLDPSYVYDEITSELYVSAQLFANAQTKIKQFNNRWSWNEILTVPYFYSLLPQSVKIVLNVWDCCGAFKDISLGRAEINLFDLNGLLLQGVYDIELNKDASSNKPLQLSEIKKQYRDKNFPKVEWLDRLTFREIEILNEQEIKYSDSMFLVIEFPPFTCDGQHISVIYYDKGPDLTYQIQNPKFVIIPDSQIDKENLAELKYHALSRGSNSLSSDTEIKPSSIVLDKLRSIISYPSFVELSNEEQDIIWRYRYYLIQHNKALPKFLKSVKWDNDNEAKQALELMFEWQPIEPEDALELLTPSFSIKKVRHYAVFRLQQSNDEELFFYLLQLVQALRYEDYKDVKGYHRENKLIGKVDAEINRVGQEPQKDLDLATFLISRASKNSILANYFYWYLHVECEEQTHLFNMLSTSQIQQPTNNNARGDIKLNKENNLSKNDQSLIPECVNESHKPIITITSDDSYIPPKTVTKLEMVESNDQKRVAEIYLTIMKRFHQYLVDMGGSEGLIRKSILSRQQYFMDKLVWLVNCVIKENVNRKRKQDKLQALLHATADETLNHTKKIDFTNFDPLPLPLDPEITVNGIIAHDTILFKSGLQPCRFTFRTNELKEYKVIFKHGDDLRQDQLILQIIKLMEKLLLKENLDLKLTPYKVLATSTKHGLVQFIDSQSIAEILANYGNIQNYFRKYSSSPGSAYGIKPLTMDNYIKSCAGYCVITYILGIGDRHFDNLLITKNGKLFHIDFGYILGHDPKPMPPPMKLSKEMVEAMGGLTSKYYQDFKKHCYTAFLHLRRHANLIMNLFSLVLDANIPDISLERDKTVKKVYEKFRLDLSDEEAVYFIQNLIDLSANAVMAVLVEQIHKIAQYWRK